MYALRRLGEVRVARLLHFSPRVALTRHVRGVVGPQARQAHAAFGAARECRVLGVRAVRTRAGLARAKAASGARLAGKHGHIELAARFT